MERIQKVILKIMPHAAKRIKQRGSSLKWLMLFLKRCDTVALYRNHQGYEIKAPALKGRLVGTFRNGIFICRSFLRFNYRGRLNTEGIYQFKIRISSIIFLH